MKIHLRTVIFGFIGVLIGLVGVVGIASAHWVSSASFTFPAIRNGSLSGTFTQSHVVVDNPGSANDSEYDLSAKNHEVELPRAGGETKLYLTLRADVNFDNDYAQLELSKLVPLDQSVVDAFNANYEVTYTVYQGYVTPNTVSGYNGATYTAGKVLAVRNKDEITLVAKISTIGGSSQLSNVISEKKTVAELTAGINTDRPGFTFIGWLGSDGFLYDEKDANNDGKSLSTTFEGSIDGSVSNDITFTAQWVKK